MKPPLKACWLRDARLLGERLASFVRLQVGGTLGWPGSFPRELSVRKQGTILVN